MKADNTKVYAGPIVFFEQEILGIRIPLSSAGVSISIRSDTGKEVIGQLHFVIVFVSVKD